MRYFLLIMIALQIGCHSKTSNRKSLLTSADTLNLRKTKEILWPKSYHESNVRLLDSLLHESFQMIDQKGNWSSKEFELKWIAENEYKPDSFFYEIKRLDLYPNGTAVIAGTGHIFNDSIESTYESSNVLVKQEDGWKAILSHVSGVKN